MTTATHEQHVADILTVALAYSRETRGQVAADLDGMALTSRASLWQDIIGQRSKDGSHKRLKSAGRALVKLSTETAKPYVRRAVKNLLAAVKALAEYRPEYVEQQHTVPAVIARRMSLGNGDVGYSTWTLKTDSVAKLDALRERAKIAFIHLEALFERHDTPALRLLAVAQRVAAVVLEPTAARLVANWFASLERGDGA